MDEIARLAEIIKDSKSICVFTGAGISCPSGIPDFRSSNGLYNREYGYDYSPEEIISHSFFVEKPELFYEFYKSAMLYPDAKPNDAHRFLAKLEEKGKKVSVVTQNIDSLHQKAGSKNVIELHGSVERNYCVKCKRAFSLDYIVNQSGIPYCDKCGGIIKPDVVLYEEPLDNNTVERAISAIERADTVIVVGTSLVVYPAASYLRFYQGNNLVLINKSKTSYDSLAAVAINDDVVSVVRELEKQGV